MRTLVALAISASACGFAACGADGKGPEAGTPPAAATDSKPSVTAQHPKERAEGGTTMTVKATVGQPAPDFRAKDQTGKERTLAEFRGKRVALWFFPKADTPG